MLSFSSNRTMLFSGETFLWCVSSFPKANDKIFVCILHLMHSCTLPGTSRIVPDNCVEEDSGRSSTSQKHFALQWFLFRKCRGDLHFCPDLVQDKQRQEQNLKLFQRTQIYDLPVQKVKYTWCTMSPSQNVIWKSITKISYYMSTSMKFDVDLVVYDRK